MSKETPNLPSIAGVKKQPDKQEIGAGMLDSAVTRLDSHNEAPETQKFKGFSDAEKKALREAGATGISVIENGRKTVIQYGKDVPVRHGSGKPVYGARIEIWHNNVREWQVSQRKNVETQDGKHRNVTSIKIHWTDEYAQPRGGDDILDVESSVAAK